MGWSDVRHHYIEDDGRHDGAPEVRVLRQGKVKARKPWVCTGCRRIRPAGDQTEICVGKVDGEFFSDRRCIPTADHECPYRVASWPLWRLLFGLRPGADPQAGAPFTIEARAPTMERAEQDWKEAYEGSNPDHQLTGIVKVEDGTPEPPTIDELQHRDELAALEQQAEAMLRDMEGEG